MVKKIKFNLLLDGKSIGDFEQLQDNFSADLLDYIENQKLAKWFSVRDMDDKAQQVSEINSNASPMEQMKAFCRILELYEDEDEDVINYLLEARDARDKAQSENLSNFSSTGSFESIQEQQDDVDKKPKGEDWSGREFKDRDFTGADLRGYNLSGQTLVTQTLRMRTFSGCDLSKAIFDGSILARTNFTNCNLKEAKIINVQFPKQRGWASVRTICTGETVAIHFLEGIEGQDFSNAILDGSVMSGNFVNADLTNVHAHQVDASKAEFYRALMDGADFSFSTLCQKGVPEDQKMKAKMFGVKWV